MFKPISKDNSTFLDFIRGISAQIVLIGHLLSFYGFQQYYHIPVIQNFGVVIFFVLSGFLITQTTLLKGVDYGFNNYLADRFARIFYTFVPGLLFVLAIDCILVFYLKTYDPAFRFNGVSFIANLLMLHPLPYIERFGVESFGSGRPFWTVGIEWWCYLFFGFLFYLRRSKYGIVPIILFAISIIFIVYNIQGRGVGLSLYWALGFVVAMLFNKFDFRISNTILVITFGFLFVAFVFRGYFYPEMYDLGLAALFGAILFLLMYPSRILERIAGNLQFKRFSTFIVSYSYSLYLVHYTVIVFMQYFLPGQLNVTNVAIIFVVANLVAYLFHLAFEKNHYRFRKFVKKLLGLERGPILKQAGVK